jgi:hypothetical protein
VIGAGIVLPGAASCGECGMSALGQKEVITTKGRTVKTKNMNFIEAVLAAQDGHKIRRAGWCSAFIDKNNKMRNDVNDRLFEPVISDYLADDWEIVLEPPKTMTFTKAMAAVKAGKKVRRMIPGWETVNIETELRGPQKRLNHVAICTYAPSFDDIEATDWIEVQEEPNDE